MSDTSEDENTQEAANDEELMAMDGFAYKHLDESVHGLCQQFADLAAYLCNNLPLTIEAAESISELLESRDLAIKALNQNG